MAARAWRGLEHEAGQDVDQRRLASAIGAEQAVERAARDREIDLVERRLRRPAGIAPPAIDLGQPGQGDGMRRQGRRLQ
jgi:hypothetical protein